MKKTLYLFLMSLIILTGCATAGPKEKVQHVHFMRHARTMFNELGRVQGYSDAPLTEAAIKETRKTAEKMKDEGFKIDLIISSDLKRAKDTASIISNIYDGIEIVETDLFREVNYGEYEGLPSDTMLMGVLEFYDYQKTEEFFAKSEHFLKEITDGVKGSDSYKHAENYDEVLERMRNGMKMIEEDYTKYDHILVVGHGMSMSILSEAISGEHVNDEIPNLSINTFEKKEDMWKLVEFGNDDYIK